MILSTFYLRSEGPERERSENKKEKKEHRDSAVMRVLARSNLFISLVGFGPAGCQFDWRADLFHVPVVEKNPGGP